MGNNLQCCGKDNNENQIKDIISATSCNEKFNNSPSDIGKYIKTPPKKKNNKTKKLSEFAPKSNKHGSDKFIVNSKEYTKSRKSNQTEYMDKTVSHPEKSLKNQEEHSTSQDTEPSTSQFVATSNIDQQIKIFLNDLIKQVKFEDFENHQEWLNFDNKVDHKIYEKSNYDQKSNYHTVNVRAQELDGDSETNFWSVYENFETSLKPEEQFFITRILEKNIFIGQLFYECCRYNEVLFSTEVDGVLYFWIKTNIEKDLNKRLVEEEFFIQSAFKKINDNTFREYFCSFKPNPNDFPINDDQEKSSRINIFKGLVEYKKINENSYSIKQYCHMKPNSTTGQKLQKLSLKKYYQTWFENGIANAINVYNKEAGTDVKINYEFQLKTCHEIKMNSLDQIRFILH